MSNPLVFTARSPRLDLPYLFAGQAQKEASVNEALARIDALIAPAIEGQAAAVPASPTDGECWIVGAGALGEWAGREDTLAFYSAGTWMFADPQPGQQVFDKSDDRVLRWHGGWQSVSLPAAPSGGSTIDVEARAALALLVDELRNAGFGL